MGREIEELIYMVNPEHTLSEAKLKELVDSLIVWVNEGLNYLCLLVDTDAIGYGIDVTESEYSQIRTIYRRHLAIPLLITKIRELFRIMEAEQNESKN